MKYILTLMTVLLFTAPIFSQTSFTSRSFFGKTLEQDGKVAVQQEFAVEHDSKIGQLTTEAFLSRSNFDNKVDPYVGGTSVKYRFNLVNTKSFGIKAGGGVSGRVLFVPGKNIRQLSPIVNGEVRINRVKAEYEKSFSNENYKYGKGSYDRARLSVKLYEEGNFTVSLQGQYEDYRVKNLYSDKTLLGGFAVTIK